MGSKVAHIVVAAGNMRIQNGWLDEVIGYLCARRYHFIVAQKEEQLSIQLTELQEEMGKVY